MKARSSLALSPALILGTILALTVCLGVMLALVRRPDVDEAWFAGAAWSLAYRGYMGTPLIEAANIGLQGIGERTYWILPLEPVMLAGWYKIVGFSLLTSRLFSIVWAALGVLSLYHIVASVTEQKKVAFLAAGLLGLDYAFLRGAASVRMDMMTLALGLLAFAVFLRRQEISFVGSVIAAETFLAAGLFTHPNGIVAVLLFHILILFRYRDRLTVTLVILAALPYVALALLWGAYILQNTADFAAQMDANAAGRFRLWTRPWIIPVDGFRRLLLTPFGFGGAWAGPATRLKVVVLLIYLLATILVLVKREWWRRPGTKDLLIALGFTFLLLSSIVSANDNDYVIFLIPWFCALLGMVVVYWWNTRVWRVRVGPAVLGLTLFFQLGMTGARIRINDMRSQYGSAVAFLRENMRQNETIAGSSELGFALGFDAPIRDDDWLGRRTGFQPDWVVIEHRYRSNADARPQHREHNRNVLQAYDCVYSRDFYEIYRRRSGNEEPGPDVIPAAECPAAR